MSLIYYLLLLSVLFLIIEIIAILFKVTGLDVEKARFQIISIITHTGFTTRESELISQHPMRRRIAGSLMLASYLGQAGFISIFLNMMREQRIGNLFVVILVLIIMIFLFVRNKHFLSHLDLIIERTILGQLKKNKKYRTVDEVLKLNPEYGVSEIILNEKSSLCGISLMDTGLKKRSIQVLNVDRGSHIIHFPKASLIFSPGDKVVVYGKIDSIKELILQQQ